jgi:hypothetical protein
MAKLVLVIVTLGMVLILTVLVKFVTVTLVGKLSTRTVEVKLLTTTVPVMAGKLLIATVPLTAGIEAMFTVLVKFVTVTLVGKLLTETVPVMAGKLAMFTVDVKLSTVTLPVTPTLQVPLCTAYIVPFTYCSAGQFVTVVTQGLVPWYTVEVVGKLLTVTVTVFCTLTLSNAASVELVRLTVSRRLTSPAMVIVSLPSVTRR